MVEKLIYKLIDINSFELRLNERLGDFDLISSIFKNKNIPYISWRRDEFVIIDVIEMSFSASCKFQDVYLLAYLLREIGLEHIYPSRKEESVISIGTYLFDFSDYNKNIYAMSKPMDIDDFLKIDPKLKTQDVINLYFNEQYSDEVDESDEEVDFEQDFEQDDIEDSNYNLERDNFNALTDGMYGEFDDWQDNGGDFDSLYDGIGY